MRWSAVSTAMSSCSSWPSRAPLSVPGRPTLGGSASGGTSIGELMNLIGACIQHSVTAYDMAVFQMGTHPALTASPIAYHLVNAAEMAVKAMK